MNKWNEGRSRGGREGERKDARDTQGMYRREAETEDNKAVNNEKGKRGNREGQD